MNKGFAELPTVIILSLIILAIGIGLMVRVSTETEMRKTSLSSQESFYLSDSGVDDALLKITRNKLAEPKGVSAFSTSSLRVGISMEGTSTTVSTSTIFSLSKLKGEYKDIKTIIEVSEYGKINTTTASWRQAITKGTFTGALSFDGVDDYVEISHSDAFPREDVTVEFWLYRRECGIPASYITKRTINGNGLMFFMHTGNRLYFDWGDGTSNRRWDTGYSPPLNEWVHLTITRDASGRYLYGRVAKCKIFQKIISKISLI